MLIFIMCVASLTILSPKKPRCLSDNIGRTTFTTEYEEKCAACCKTIADTFYELLTIQ
ncbi:MULTISPECIES: hypothetical protein [unclassified Dehalobacter]|uniref:hypothetical protein n=1 Tax=unclassified Dehalobacter TaxID=2635733 RepID=UPI0014043F11|nr:MULTISPECIES: hypothetical protein [unclassified Dehalobacter]